MIRVYRVDIGDGGHIEVFAAGGKIMLDADPDVLTIKEATEAGMALTLACKDAEQQVEG